MKTAERKSPRIGKQCFPNFNDVTIDLMSHRGTSLCAFVETPIGPLLPPLPHTFAARKQK